MLTEKDIAKIIEKQKAQNRDALTGERYYNGEHDILHYRVFYKDKDGCLVEDKSKSNERIPHPFFSELTDQEVQYLLSSDERFALSDIPELQNLLDEAFNDSDDFRDGLSAVATDAISKGKGYFYAHKDESGRVLFERADALGIAEVRDPDTNDEVSYVVRWYIDRIDDDGERILKIEVWDKEQVWYYVQEGNKAIELDKNAPMNPRPHTLMTDEKGQVYSENFGQIPFFKLKNNDREKSDLFLTKPIIDDYDLMACGLSNNLQDLSEGFWVVRNYQGDNIGELINALKVKKAIGVDENGGVELKTVNIPYEARKAKLQLDREGIYKFGMGVDTSQVGDGNITNVVIKSRYADLDLKVNKFEKRLKRFLRQIIGLYLEIDGRWSIKDVKLNFERSIISSESDDATIELTRAQARQTDINTLMILSGVLPDETLIKTACKVLDIDYEEIKADLPEHRLDDDGEGEDETDNEE